VALRVQAVIVNCLDPGALAEFWAAALGWRVTIRGDPEWGIEPPEGSREDCVVPDMLFLRVPEPKQGLNRLHLDLRPDADQAAEVARLEALGATRADVGQNIDGGDVSWVVMADPEGNEFCVLAPYPPEVRTQWPAQYEAYRPVAAE
jgi:hypothetical protein